MKKWVKTSLLSATVLLTLLISLVFLFRINLSIPSFDIEFSPGPSIQEELPEYTGEKPRNIILFICDGMGFSHLSLALMTQQSQNKPSVWQAFDVKGWHDARSIVGPLTDSEASATAMATGASTNFGHIGIDNDGNILKNAFELASEKGYTTGIVTDSYVWDGTPAAFVAHTKNEDDARDILTQIAMSELDLIFGELEDEGEDDVPEREESLEILRKRFRLLDKSLELPGLDAFTEPVAAIFSEDQVQDLSSSPSLTQLTDTALKYLSLKENPFVLLVESEEMDEASHKNDSKRVVKGLESIESTLALIQDFAQKDGQTLLIFTADHETGGLAAVSDFREYPNMQIRWSSKHHTAVVVPLLAVGPGAEYFADVHRNSDIGVRLKSLINIVNQELQ